MFGTWLQGIRWKEKSLILTGVSAVCWAMWLSKNDIVFDKVNQQPYLQILFRTTLDKISGFASEKEGHEYVF